MVREHDLSARVGCVLMSCVFHELDPRDLVAWVLEDALREQLQMHKYIWAPDATGV